MRIWGGCCSPNRVGAGTADAARLRQRQGRDMEGRLVAGRRDSCCSTRHAGTGDGNRCAGAQGEGRASHVPIVHGDRHEDSSANHPRLRRGATDFICQARQLGSAAAAAGGPRDIPAQCRRRRGASSGAPYFDRVYTGVRIGSAASRDASGWCGRRRNCRSRSRSSIWT